MRVRDVMTPRPRAVTPDDSVARAAEIMRDLEVGAVPVVDDLAGMRLCGVITDRDVTVRCVASRHRGDCPVRDHMSAGHLETVEPDDDVDAVMACMRAGGVRRVLVTAGGRLVGIVSLGDLARHAGPIAPLKVEWVLERVSEPAEALATA